MSNPSKLLIVDDEPLNINVLVELFRTDYRLVVAKSGSVAIQRAHDSPPPDLILLDIMMPEMNGYQVLQVLKGEPATRDIPVIFVTALGEVNDEAHGLELGAVDYVTKPISPAIVKARVKNHLELNLARQWLANQNTILERRVAERTRELQLTQDITIQALAYLAEIRDNETGGHIRRTQNYLTVLARAAADRQLTDLDERSLDMMAKSAPLHDIGKVGVPDHILLKPGKLTDEEFAEIKKHPVLGRDALNRAQEEMGESSSGSFLRIARDITYTHHERWDGSGYPEGLAGEDIPMVGRLMALADVYDALISKRVYKPALSHEQAVAIISQGRGSHFDPALVDLFIEHADEFRQIALRFAD